MVFWGGKIRERKQGGKEIIDGPLQKRTERGGRSGNKAREKHSALFKYGRSTRGRNLKGVTSSDKGCVRDGEKAKWKGAGRVSLEIREEGPSSWMMGGRTWRGEGRKKSPPQKIAVGERFF